MDELFGQDARNESDCLHFELRYKMLETGVFQLPPGQADAQAYALAYEQLVMIIEGIEISTAKRKKRYCGLTNQTA